MQILLTAIILLFCSMLQISSMPYMQSSEPEIDIEPAQKQLTVMFDDLLAQDARLAYSALDFSIRSLLATTMTRRHASSPARYRSDRIAHIKECQETHDYIRSGFRGFYILQSRLADHLDLLMSVTEENKLIMWLMYSIDLGDVGASIEDYNAQLLSDEEQEALLLRHAIEKKYKLWQTFLRFAAADEDDEY